ncbi:taurine catabolism dioxygenase [Colletotrichum plurivorum]|uniref:Taurine catabolism dioxygenase n=1 Tax=Colletotrichum plurivorum TaxID=2175906 RepID=A0A8H6NK88_9PEZI|nr:taurine catabolism dioxygenase [Colletotrichum plurivorum]
MSSTRTISPQSGLPSSALDSWDRSNDNQPLFQPFNVPGQQDTANFGLSWSASFPLGLQVTRRLNLDDSIDAIRRFTESGNLKQLVKQHGGAILIRGLPIETPDDYSRVAHAFGFRPHIEVGRPPLRTVLAPNVKTANEGPPELPIWPHSEYGWSTINPAWLTFSALQLPESGGGTPITSAIYVAHELARQAPRFFSELLDKGVKYVYRYTVNPLVSNTGTSVRGAYGQEITDEDDEATARRKIEAEVRRHSERFEWHEDGSLSVTHIVPAIRIHDPTEATVFFGNVTSAWGRSRHHGATRPPFRGDDGSYHPPPTYGDGTPIDVEDLDLLLKLAEDGAVDVEWEKGDLVLLDNYAVMHSRKPWKGQRQVLAALWDDDGRIRDFPEGLELLKSSPRVPRTEADETVG